MSYGVKLLLLIMGAFLIGMIYFVPGSNFGVSGYASIFCSIIFTCFIPLMFVAAFIAAFIYKEDEERSQVDLMFLIITISLFSITITNTFNSGVVGGYLLKEHRILHGLDKMEDYVDYYGLDGDNDTEKFNDLTVRELKIMIKEGFLRE